MNPNEPAYPVNELDQTLHTVAVQHFGISVRMHIAIEAMKGMLANPQMHCAPMGDGPRKCLIKDAWLIADDMLAHFNATTPASSQALADQLKAMTEDDTLMEIGRLAIEDELVSRRDNRIFEGGRNNGLAIKERDGEPSNVIRMGPEVGLRIALTAIAEHIAR